MSKELFEKGLVNTIRKVMTEYDKHSNDKALTDFVASIELSSMGNFTDPETGNKYGYKLTIGEPDFFKEVSEEEDEWDDED